MLNPLTIALSKYDIETIEKVIQISEGNLSSLLDIHSINATENTLDMSLFF
jgi:hypothetical protein